MADDAKTSASTKAEAQDPPVKAEDSGEAAATAMETNLEEKTEDAAAATKTENVKEEKKADPPAKKEEEEGKTENKTEAEASKKNEGEETSKTSADTVAKVAERLRFFYSDANIRMDRFMRIQLLKSTDGFVPIETLLRFNSIKCHTTDSTVVAEATKHESVKDRVQLSSSGKGIGRVVPFDMKTMGDNVDLSLLVSNLPLTGTHDDKKGRSHVPKYDVTVDQVRELFQPYGYVALVKMRFGQYDPNETKKNGDGEKGDSKYQNPNRRARGMHTPLGSAFVEFETKEELAKAVEDLCVSNSNNGEEGGEGKKPKKTLTLGGKTLKVITMREWVDGKEKRKKEKASENGATKEEGAKKRPREEEGEKADGEKMDEDEKMVEKGGGDEEKDDKVECEEFTLDWKPGCVISLKGLSSDKCDREGMRETVQTFLALSDDDFQKAGIYVDYSRGQDHGAIRFREPSDKIAELSGKLEAGEVTISDEKVETAKVLDGDEEKKYWEDFIKFKNRQIRENASRKKPKYNHRGGGRRFRGRR